MDAWDAVEAADAPEALGVGVWMLWAPWMLWRRGCFGGCGDVDAGEAGDAVGVLGAGGRWGGGRRGLALHFPVWISHGKASYALLTGELLPSVEEDVEEDDEEPEVGDEAEEDIPEGEVPDDRDFFRRLSSRLSRMRDGSVLRMPTATPRAKVRIRTRAAEPWVSTNSRLTRTICGF